MNLSKPHDIWTGLRFKSCCKLPSEANLQGRCQDQADDSQHDLYEQAQPAQSNAARVQELLLLQKAAPQGLSVNQLYWHQVLMTTHNILLSGKPVNIHNRMMTRHNHGTKGNHMCDQKVRQLLSIRYLDCITYIHTDRRMWLAPTTTNQLFSARS